MTAERSIYFLERFKRDEKLLGPNEQLALDFAINALAPAPQPNPSTVDADAVIERLTKALNLAADRLDAASHRVGDHDSRAAFGIAQWAIDARAALAAQGEKP